MDEQSTQELEWRESDYVPIIPILRAKKYKVKSRRMMDKMLNRYFDKGKRYKVKSRRMMDKMLDRYFDKVVEDEYNQQRMMSDQWLEKRAMFDSYMNLSPADRRWLEKRAMFDSYMNLSPLIDVVLPFRTCVDIKFGELIKRTYCCIHSRTTWSTMPKLTDNSTRSLSSL